MTSVSSASAAVLKVGPAAMVLAHGIVMMLLLKAGVESNPGPRQGPRNGQVSNELV
jgi:hypothetical protein